MPNPAPTWQGYCRPEFVRADEEPRLLLRGARHPMLDAQLGAAAVANDLQLSWAGQVGGWWGQGLYHM
jgi:DNA mismatch repair ATPase MutS